MRVALKGWNRCFVVAVIAVAAALIPIVANKALALDDARVKQLEDSVVQHICSETNWLVCWGEQPSNCNRIIRSFTGRCIRENLMNVEAGLNQQRAQQMGLRIITCFNSEFLAAHPMGKRDAPECKEIPKHLK